MEATEYVSPQGATQTVDTAVVAVRLRARGWRPRTELEEAAAYDQAAADVLQRARDRAEQREARRQERQDEASRRTAGSDQPAEEQPLEEQPEPAVVEQPAEPAVPAVPGSDRAPEGKPRPEPKPKRRPGA